ncbi:MAG: putative capsular polysaccharide synthesis family protein [Anaerolineales bacterium]
MNRIHHRLLRLTKTHRQAYPLILHGMMVYYDWIVRRGGKPILVYQMGKVGSQTVVETINRLQLNRPVFHFHWMNSDSLAFTRQKAEDSGRAYPGKDYWESMYVRNRLLLNQNKAAHDIITLTRDPVARNLSAFFHSITYWYPGYYHQLDDPGFNQETLFEGIKRKFIDTYIHQKTLDWFDKELRLFFGFDIYRERFIPQQGFRVYQGENLNLLVLRMEDLDECLNAALEEFFNTPLVDFKIENKNRSAQKEYHQLYDQFRSWLILPGEFLDEMYGSDFARFFYTQEEINRFRKRWSTRETQLF